jgi:uncharacterized protein (TIGR02466 family)
MNENEIIGHDLYYTYIHGEHFTQGYNLFPSTVLSYNIGRELTEDELSCIQLTREDSHKNVGNYTSNDSDVLNNEQLHNIKLFIDNSINNYYRTIKSATADTQIYITDSWCNFSDPGDYHHEHIHPNSYLSGVFYVQANVEKDNICFHRKVYEAIRPQFTEETLYNCLSWCIPVRTGDLLIFDSSLGHSVPKTASDKTRISIAFNTFLRGTIGTKDSKARLILR